MARELRPCGTQAAYQRHKEHGEDPYGPCAEAQRAYRKERNAALTARARRARAQQQAEEAAEIERLVTPEGRRELARQRDVLAAHFAGDLVLG